MEGDLAVELPFRLAHPKPVPTPSPSRQLDQHVTDVSVDHNLNQLDATFAFLSFHKKPEIFFFLSFYGAGPNGDFIFEEFARISLKGHESGRDDTEA